MPPRNANSKAARKPARTSRATKRSAKTRSVATSPHGPTPVAMLAQYDPATRTHVMPLQYPPTGAAPSVQAWLEIAPDYALRVVVCTDCGQRCTLEVPHARVRDGMPSEDWDAALAGLAFIFEESGFPKEDHMHCKPFADSGATACRESTWAVPHTVPATHRFEIDDFLDDTVGSATQECNATALLRLERPNGECVSVREILPSTLIEASTATMASRAWCAAVHHWLNMVAMRHHGRLEALALVVKAAEPVVRQGHPAVAAVVIVATHSEAYQGVVAAPASLADRAGGDHVHWRALVGPSPLVDRLFAVVVE